MVVQLSPDGVKAALYSDESGFVPYEKLIFICCNHIFSQGRDAALPFDFTFAAEDYAKSREERYIVIIRPATERGRACPQACEKSRILRLTEFFLAAMVIGILCGRKINLKQAVSELPDFYTTKRFINTDGDNIRSIMNHWEGEKNS